MPQQTSREKKKQVFAWAMYDWANSAFATTVMAGFFPIFFKQYCSSGLDPQTSTAVLGGANSLSSLAVALLAPFLGALCDRRGERKRFLWMSTLAGAGATAGLAFVSPGDWELAALLFGLASFGFGAALIFYDSFLPSVSEGGSPDRVSALGYALGYLGGALLFTFNVAVYLRPGVFGLASSEAAQKFAFLTVAVWWVLFSLPLFRYVPEEPGAGDRQAGMWPALRSSLSEIYSDKRVLFFLFAYWLYIDAVYSVMKMALDYGAALGLEGAHLVGALLLTQFVGFPAALLFGVMGARFGAARAITAGLAVYCGVTVWASLLSRPWEFYLLAGVVGLVQGGVQALSRSHFARMVPPGESARYFSLFNIVGKFATILGPTLVGMTAYLTGSSRLGILSLLILFSSGIAILNKRQVKTESETAR